MASITKADVPHLLQPSETGLEYINAMTRQVFATGEPFLDTHNQHKGLATGSLVELLGGPRVGKTRMALNVTSTFVLPRPLGGHETHVVYLDMDGRFRPARLRKRILDRVVEKRTSSTNTIRIQNSNIVDACMRRVLVIKCEDARLVRVALDRINALTDTYSIGLLVLSNLSGCFFDNRVRNNNNVFGTMVAKKIEQIRHRCRLVILAMTATLFDSKRSSNTGHLLGKAWDRLPKYKVALPLSS